MIDQPTTAQAGISDRANSPAVDPHLLGSTIRRLRRHHGLSHGELAGGALSTAHISRIEAGERSPSAAALEHIAARLHTTPVALLAGSTDDNATWSREAVAVADATSEWLRAPPTLARTPRWWTQRHAGRRRELEIVRASPSSPPPTSPSPHAGQVDQQGPDYFTAHLAPIANALKAFGPSAVMAGYLHDILEDPDQAPTTLAKAGVPGDVVDAVLAVTRIQERPGA